MMEPGRPAVSVFILCSINLCHKGFTKITPYEFLIAISLRTLSVDATLMPSLVDTRVRSTSVPFLLQMALDSRHFHKETHKTHYSLFCSHTRAQFKTTFLFKHSSSGSSWAESPLHTYSLVSFPQHQRLMRVLERPSISFSLCLFTPLNI